MNDALRGTHIAQSATAMMFGPTLPLLLLVIPVAMAGLVFFAGLASLFRPKRNLPRAVIVDRTTRAR